MTQTVPGVNEHSFSNLYTYLAHVTGIPRPRVKHAVISVFYTGELTADFVEIINALRREDKDENGNALWLDEVQRPVSKN